MREFPHFSGGRPDIVYVENKPFIVPQSVEVVVSEGRFNLDSRSHVWSADFQLFGDQVDMEIACRPAPFGFKVIVDNHFVSSDELHFNSRNVKNVRIKFDSKAARNIRFETYSTIGIGRLFTPPGSFIGANIAPRTKVAVFGDSYVTGGGTQYKGNAWCNVMAAKLGWSDIWQMGLGGTGYKSGYKTLLPIGEHLTDLFKDKFDVIVFAAGYNDKRFEPEEVKPKAIECFQKARQYNATAPIIVFGVWRGSTAPDRKVLRTEAAVKAAVKESGVSDIYFVPISSNEIPWMSEKDTRAIKAAGGDLQKFIYEDRSHPTDGGHIYLGTRAAEAVKALVYPKMA